MNYTYLHYIRYYVTEVMLSYNVRVRAKSSVANLAILSLDLESFYRAACNADAVL